MLVQIRSFRTVLGRLARKLVSVVRWPFAALGSFWETRKNACYSWLRGRRATLAAQAAESSAIAGKAARHFARTVLLLPEFFFGLKRLNQAVVVLIVGGATFATVASGSWFEQRYGLGPGEFALKRLSCSRMAPKWDFVLNSCTNLTEKQTRTAKQIERNILQDQINAEDAARDAEHEKRIRDLAANGAKRDQKAQEEAERTALRDAQLEMLLASNGRIEKLLAESVNLQRDQNLAVKTLNEHLSGARSMSKTEQTTLVAELSDNRAKDIELRKRYADEMKENERLRASIAEEAQLTSTMATADSNNIQSSQSGDTELDLIEAASLYTTPPLLPLPARGSAVVHVSNGTQIDVNDASPEDIRALLDEIFASTDGVASLSSYNASDSDAIHQNAPRISDDGASLDPTALLETQNEALTSQRALTSAQIEDLRARTADRIQDSAEALETTQEQYARRRDEQLSEFADLPNSPATPTDFDIGEETTVPLESPRPFDNESLASDLAERIENATETTLNRSGFAFEAEPDFANPTNPGNPPPPGQAGQYGGRAGALRQEYFGFSQEDYGFSNPQTGFDDFSQDGFDTTSPVSPQLRPQMLYGVDPSSRMLNGSSNLLTPGFDMPQQNWGTFRNGVNPGSFDFTSPMNNGVISPHLNQPIINTQRGDDN